MYKVNIPCCVSNLVFYAQSNITVISRDVNDFCDKRTSSVIILKSCSVLSIYQEEHNTVKNGMEGAWVSSFTSVGRTKLE